LIFDSVLIVGFRFVISGDPFINQRSTITNDSKIKNH